MAYEIQVFDVGTLVAVADLSTKQFQCVKIDATGKVALCAAAGEHVAGVLQEKPVANEAARFRQLGITHVKTGAAVAKGDKLKTDATGKAVAAQAAYVKTDDAGAAQDPVVGSFVFAIALEAASAADQIISALLVPMGAIPTTAA